MTTRKTALDSAAKAYLEEYYGDYGRQYTRHIPRRVRSMLAPLLRKDAAASMKRAASSVAVVNDEYLPLGYTIRGDDSLVVEGIVKAAMKDGSKVARMFCAHFAASGDLIDFASRPCAEVVG